MKQRAKELVDEFLQYSYQQEWIAKEVALISINNEEKALESHGIKREQFYIDLRNEIKNYNIINKL